MMPPVGEVFLLTFSDVQRSCESMFSQSGHQFGGSNIRAKQYTRACQMNLIKRNTL